MTTTQADFNFINLSYFFFQYKRKVKLKFLYKKGNETYTSYTITYCVVLLNAFRSVLFSGQNFQAEVQIPILQNDDKNFQMQEDCLNTFGSK